MTLHRCVAPVVICAIIAAFVAADFPAAESQPFSPAQGGTRQVGAKWALLVGIDQYERDISPLDFAVADVKALAQALIENTGFPADNVKVMTSDVRSGINHPDHINVIKRLDGLANLIRPNDTFLFYFSGHGFQKDGKHFLATVNTDRDSVETLQVSSIPLDLLRRKMSKIQAHRVVFIIDACRNDPEKGRGEGDNVRTDDFSKDLIVAAKSAASGIAGTAVFFACAEGERAYEWKEKGHGVFTYYLLEGLRGKGAEANGELTMGSLGDFVQRNVLRWSQENLAAKMKTQRPELLQLGAAKIVLADAVRVTNTQDEPPASGKRINPKDAADMVFVPAGEFIMGSEDHDDEKPQRRVYLDGYWIYKHPVTVAQYQKFSQSANRPMPSAPTWGWKDDHPIVNVSWDDATAYARWAGVQLPTEAQWEKAARGVDGRKFPWGNEWVPGRCWHSKSQFGDAGSTAAVGAHPQSVSLYGAEMVGNVWQWCADWYDENYYKNAPSRNPTGPGAGQYRVLRGGSWYTNTPVYFRCAYRFRYSPVYRDYNLGFRCAQGL